MTSTNKYLLFFLGIGGGLSLIVGNALFKSLPVLLRHTVYYCQQFVHTFAVRLPFLSGQVILFVLVFFLITIVYKVFRVVGEIRQLHRRLKVHIPFSPSTERLLKKLHIEKKVLLIQSEKPFAFCFGIRSPQIYLSTKLITLMTKKELTAILLHETYHLENRDSFIMFLSSVARLFFPFFPLLSDVTIHYKIDREIAADQQAIRTLKNATPIISVLKKLLSHPTESYFSLAAIAESETLESRINALVTQKKTNKHFRLRNIIISIFSLVVLGSFSFTPVQAVEFQTPTQNNTVMVCLQSGGSCVAQCKAETDSGSARNEEQINASHPYSSRK